MNPSHGGGRGGDWTALVDDLRHEFDFRRRLPVLAVSAATFAGVGLAWPNQPIWSLALALWVGYCVAYAAAAAAGRSRLPAGVALPLMVSAVPPGALAGWLVDIRLTVPGAADTGAWARGVVHLLFVGALVLMPLGQAAWRLRTVRRIEADRARVLAELQFLQAQIEPHFLFNTLATLRSLVRQQSADALPLLDRISAFLEAVLPRVRTPLSSVGRELAIVEQYLGIMALRLRPRLAYRVQADEALLDSPLPALLIQPLVENAIVHGIEPDVSGGEIVVRASAEGGRLQLQVSNSGSPLGTTNERTHAGAGIALDNLRERLRVLHGDAGSLTLRTVDGRTVAELSLPLAPPIARQGGRASSAPPLGTFASRET